MRGDARIERLGRQGGRCWVLPPFIRSPEVLGYRAVPEAPMRCALSWGFGGGGGGGRGGRLGGWCAVWGGGAPFGGMVRPFGGVVEGVGELGRCC